MKIGIILAAGKGSRLKSKEVNKTALKLRGKALVEYGVDLFRDTMQVSVVVVGAYSDSVKDALRGKEVHFVTQAKRLGTGHAVKIAVTYIKNHKLSPDQVFVGYGDHMMFYQPEMVEEMSRLLEKNKAAIVLVSTKYADPDYLAWGRVIRDHQGFVQEIIEQKDATIEQRKIVEQNAGFYCFDYNFLEKNIQKLEKSPVTNEFYITDLIKLAVKEKRSVVAYEIPFELVGTGINTPDQLVQTNEMMEQV